jgi:uncharacterized protein with HEPN domain
MKRNVALYISDIIEYMERAELYIRDLTLEEFSADQKTCDAVIRCIEIVGEATKNVPMEIREKYPSVPWRDMAGMRDKIIHGYFTVDFDEVWITVKEEFPKLKPLVKKVLEDLKNGEMIKNA